MTKSRLRSLVTYEIIIQESIMHSCMIILYPPSPSRLHGISMKKSRKITLHCRHSYQVNSFCYSPIGTRIVSGSDDKTFRIWDYSNDSLFCTLECHSDRILSVACSDNGSFIISEDGKGRIRVWDAKSNNVVYKLTNAIHRVV